MNVAIIWSRLSAGREDPIATLEGEVGQFSANPAREGAARFLLDFTVPKGFIDVTNPDGRSYWLTSSASW